MIKTLSIKNFRSIKELVINPKDLTALIGPNSAGKTNVLKAIDLVLGEGWTTKAKVAKELFNDINKDIEIRIDFTEPISHNDNYKGNVSVNYITLNMTYYPNLHCDIKLWSEGNAKPFYVNEEFKKNCHFIYIPSNRDLASQMRVSNWTLLGKLMKVVYDNYVR
jgi:putative ATP-dependent endonuclease of OLD family